MKKHSSIFYPLYSILLALVFVGAGCFGLNGDDSGVDTATDGGMWKSVDAGESWVQSVSVPRANAVGSASGVNVLTIETDPSDSNAIYVGSEGDGMLFSYDTGVTWQQSQDATARTGAVTAIAVDPSNKCRVYLSLGNRILRSDDCNRNFDQTLYVESKPGVIVTAMAIDWFNSENVFAALSDGTVLKSTNRGADWSSVFRGRQAITDMIVSKSDSRIVLVGMAGAGMARTLDGGLTWESILDQLRPFRDAARVIAFSEDKQGGVIYAATYFGVLRSQDQGATWEGLNLLTAPNEILINSIATDPANPNYVTYGVGNTIYRSRDAGVNWAIQRLPTTRVISQIIFDHSNSANLYLGLRRIQR